MLFTRFGIQTLSLATPVFLLFMSVGTVFGIGGTSVISRALGEGRRDYAKKVCSFCMWCCVGVGVLISVLFLVFMDQILALIGASAETWDYAKTYLMVLSIIVDTISQKIYKPANIYYSTYSLR